MCLINANSKFCSRTVITIVWYFIPRPHLMLRPGGQILGWCLSDQHACTDICLHCFSLMIYEHRRAYVYVLLYMYMYVYMAANLSSCGKTSRKYHIKFEVHCTCYVRILILQAQFNSCITLYMVAIGLPNNYFTVQPENLAGNLNLAVLVWWSSCLKISYLHILYVWRSLTELPNLNPPILFAMAIWAPTTKFNSCQYFWLNDIPHYRMQDLISMKKFAF